MTEKRHAVGDFVWVYEGMGESGHGTIAEVLDQGYTVKIFDYGGPNEYERHVGYLDARAKCTIEEAMDYFFVRSGGKRIKLWLRAPHSSTTR